MDIKANDIIKLKYQGYFGPNHLFDNKELLYKYFNAEYELTEPKDINLYEKISDKYVRVNFAAWKYHNKDKDTLFNMFYNSLNSESNINKDAFFDELKKIADNTTDIDIKKGLLKYIEKGEVVPVSHSEEYKKAYDPHYRVVNISEIPELLTLSLKELWQLFPIKIVEHNNEWDKWYNDEKEYLNSILKDITYNIYHIGSTAVKDIKAKNIVDIIIESSDIKSIKEMLVNNGYILMNEEGSRISLNKGYTKVGFSDKVFHIHLRLIGDIDEVYFVKLLNDNLKVKLKYQKLKEELAIKYEFNRDSYTNAKTKFIKKYTLIAKKIYKID